MEVNSRMVNYGYGPGMANWHESKKNILADSLQTLLSEMIKEGSISVIGSACAPAPPISLIF